MTHEEEELLRELQKIIAGPFASWPGLVVLMLALGSALLILVLLGTHYG